MARFRVELQAFRDLRQACEDASRKLREFRRDLIPPPLLTPGDFEQLRTPRHLPRREGDGAGMIPRELTSVEDRGRGDQLTESPPAMLLAFHALRPWPRFAREVIDSTIAAERELGKLARLSGSSDLARRYAQLARDRHRAEVEASRTQIWAPRSLAEITAELVDEVAAGKLPALAAEPGDGR